MPLYEYHCEPCQRDFEKLRARTDEVASAACPICGGDAKRRLSTFAIAAAGGTTAAAAHPGPSCPGSGGCATGACPFRS